MLARKNDIAFLQKIITEIKQDSKLNTSDKAALLLGVITSISKKMEQDKFKLGSMGMANFQTLLNKLKEPLLQYYGKELNNHGHEQKSEEQFKRYLEGKKTEFQKFDLTLKILKAPSTILAGYDGIVRRDRGRGVKGDAGLGSGKLPPSPGSNKKLK